MDDKTKPLRREAKPTATKKSKPLQKIVVCVLYSDYPSAVIPEKKAATPIVTHYRL